MRYRSWIFLRDKDFAVKAGWVLDLYERCGGAELGDDEYVISADEKSQLQALSRCHPELAPAPRRARRLREFEPRYNATATPFDWRFTRADLTELCRRIDAHRPANPVLAA